MNKMCHLAVTTIWSGKLLQQSLCQQTVIYIFGTGTSGSLSSFSNNHGS